MHDALVRILFATFLFLRLMLRISISAGVFSPQRVDKAFILIFLQAILS
jgi:hypothetical protein